MASRAADRRIDDGGRIQVERIHIVAKRSRMNHNDVPLVSFRATNPVRVKLFLISWSIMSWTRAVTLP